jgi:hypothetical protein
MLIGKYGQLSYTSIFKILTSSKRILETNLRLPPTGWTISPAYVELRHNRKRKNFFRCSSVSTAPGNVLSDYSDKHATR